MQDVSEVRLRTASIEIGFRLTILVFERTLAVRS